MANDDLLRRADRAIENSRSLRNKIARIKAEARLSQERTKRTLKWASEGPARHLGWEMADMAAAASLENPEAHMSDEGGGFDLQLAILLR